MPGILLKFSGSSRVWKWQYLRALGLPPVNSLSTCETCA